MNQEKFKRDQIYTMIPSGDQIVTHEQQNKIKSKNFDEFTINMHAFIKKYYTVKNQYLREFLAEMLGTTLLVLFGCASVAQYKLRKADPTNNPIFLTINLTFGFGIMLAILITSKISGGHLNPAISFAALLVGKMSVFRFFVYSLAQFFGAFFGACFVYINYMDSLNILPDSRTLKYASIFATYPRETLTTFGCVIDQFMGTFLLVFVFLAVIDLRNNSREDGLHWTTVAFVMGITVTLIGMSFGYNSAYAINPARDFSPRLFTLFVGWGRQVFTAYNYFFWIPLVVPMISSFFATIFYTLLINNTNEYQIIN